MLAGVRVAMLGVLAAAAGCAFAQGYPAKAIRLVVPFSPGGSTDIVARLIAQKMADSVGQQVVVDNRPGAGGIVGAEIVARSAPDGYTLLTATTGIMAINQFLYRHLPYNPETDFAAVTQTGSLPLILVVHPSLPVHTAKELIAFAKARPGQLAYASSGIGSATHMTTELFKSMAGIDLVHIPYKGSGQVMGDILGGQIPLMFDQPVSSLQHVKAGKLRVLGITSAKRFPTLPDIPTLAEAALPGYESISWAGISAPAGTPQAVVARLNAEIARALKLPEVRDRLLHDGIEPVGSAPGAFDAHIKAERVKWEKVVRFSGARAD